jgi:hydrogenase maturation protease
MAGSKRFLVLGLGNPYLADDTIGIHIIQQATEQWEKKYCSQVDFRVDYSGNFDLLYDLSNYGKVLIVDSICTGQAEPGYCHEYRLDDFQHMTHHYAVNFHSYNLPTILEIGKRCGIELPQDVVFLGIEGREFTQFSEFPCWPLEPASSLILDRIRTTLDGWLEYSTSTSEVTAPRGLTSDSGQERPEGDYHA